MKRVIFAILVIVITATAQAKYSGGSGDPNDPYQIATAADLNDIGNHPEDFNKCFIMTADINLADFDGAGGRPAFNVIHTFGGIFDGNNQTIMNFTCAWPLFQEIEGAAPVVKNVIMVDADVNDPGSGAMACLVGTLRVGIVSNCHVINGSVNAENFSGLLVGINYSQIIGCSSSGLCVAMQRAGGLVGETRSLGTITNCQSDANVIVKYGIGGGLVGVHGGISITACRASGTVEGQGDSSKIGGLVGSSTGAGIFECFSNCDVNAGAFSYQIGGLVGYSYNTNVIDCSVNQSVVSGNSSVGGLIGYSDIGLISRCSSDVWVRSRDSGDGGLVGFNKNTPISCCCSQGRVENTIGDGVGGLVGINSGPILDCWSSADVSGHAGVGGLIGIHTSGSVKWSFSVGPVYGYSAPGGLLGMGDPCNILACFWDIDTSGQSNSAGGTGKTTPQMKTKSTFTSAGWDFVWESANGPNDVWAICEGVSYPKLAWQFVVGDSDNDKDVDFIDFAPFGNKWLQADSTLYCGGTDLTGDGFVDLYDLDAFVENWLQE
jgi:hypothetical protein